jgi:hypothetical protein
MALNLAKAAMRHRRCAENLAGNGEGAEAGYLIGLAAECALKHYLQEIGFPLVRRVRARRRNRRASQGPDPLYLHFPELTAELLAQGQGIVTGRILARLRNPSWLQGWRVRMRYEHQVSSPATIAVYHRWHAQTDSLFQEVGL